MEIKFAHALHSKSIALHYLIGGLISLSVFVISIKMGSPSSQLDFIVGGITLTILLIMGSFMFIWGIANLRALKTGKFPLSDYAVRRVLKAMYTKSGLWDPVIMAPYVDENGEKYLKFYFSVHFPVILFPVEVTIKYENFNKIEGVIDYIGELEKTGEVVKIEFMKDENLLPLGIKFYMKDGTVKELKGELAADFIFLLSLRKINVKKLYKRMKAWGVPGIK